MNFQIHYTPNGTATKERLRLGLIYAKSPPKYEIRTVAVPNVFLKIPPGAANHVETITRPVPVDLAVTSLLAHMHVRGKAFKFELTTPDGKTETLLDLPNYDFNWQLRYDFKQPRILPAGARSASRQSLIIALTISPTQIPPSWCAGARRLTTR